MPCLLGARYLTKKRENACDIDLKVKRVIVVGVGNLLMGDEGVGIHAVQELEKKELQDGVEIVDLGTAAFDLLPYIERADKLIIVDAIQGGEPAGSIYKLREKDLKQDTSKFTSLHQLNFLYTLEIAKKMGRLPEIVIFGIEPDRIEPTLELSPKVALSLATLLEIVIRETEK
jgi:hydrogenase maturation protease